MSTPLAIGDRAPDFTLPSHLDEDVSLAGLIEEGKNTVVFFYPLDWTPV